MSTWRHARAIGLLPGMATLVIPGLLVWITDSINVGWGIAALTIPVGGVLIAAGLSLVVRTVALVVTVGRGTLAPWDPTSRLVVQGPYRYVRNPMITGVLTILLGEAALLGSWAILIWTGTFFAMNAIYFPLSEEPGLRRRFGEDYERYRANVPRWVPRLRPWDPRS
jgi:protein-S-isoprenylcysteine O-methyltransferase Ste14